MGFKLFTLIEKILMLLPNTFRKKFFSTLGTIAYYASSRYRDVAYKNLDFAFDGKMSKKEKDEIVRYSFKNLLFNFLHLMEIRHMSIDDLKNKITIQNIESVKKAHEAGRSVIYVTPHYSAWELGGTSIAAFIEPITAVFKKMKNEKYQEWVLESRGKFGNKSLEKANVIKPLIKLIKKGEACGIVIDTAINPREGLEVMFLGKSVRQTSTPAYLARKYNAAIIPITIRTDDEDNYTLMLFDEIVVEKSDDESADIQKATQLQADWLTKLISDEPKFWFWIHRRWKSEYPEIYKK
ncbi:lipid A biosynthesis lauroyl acyltransferase [Candidatus Sulfurimonas baltica]|uniref:Lipid A biosynthesis acyltransferase n=1 Tax=Candidatus Sulfurimonas baltica TaxID=2740404 RepID=A0A7S7LUD6_9BACT|nr:lipid A biosynthesis lauroyl acyltransferase [Candidatus Sulfurimonas baltica]QOY51502.1 lipid A biosynthesis acyltransferase [Candidatus Sulfurimonas baltica]